MCKIIHRINAPFICRTCMCHMRYTINDRITHINVRRFHIYFSTKCHSAIRNFSVFHLFKHAQIIFHASVTVRIILTRFRQCSSVFPHFISRQSGNISLSFSDQFYCIFIHLVKIIRCMKQTVFIICAKPLYITDNGIHEFRFFLGRIGIIKTHVELSAIFLCNAVVEQYALGMSDMQKAIWFRRETGMYGRIYPVPKILIYFLLDKIP